MVKEGTFITPTGIFLVSMTVLYVVTAILHPQEFGTIIYGLMYFICIPSGYLLLTIYSLVNMNNVTWGTRESNKEVEQKKHVGVVCNRNCKLCCWDVNIHVTQETENLMLQQIQQAVNQNHSPDASSAKPNEEKTAQGAEEGLHHSQTDNRLIENNKDVPLRMGDINNLSSDKEDTKSVWCVEACCYRMQKQILMHVKVLYKGNETILVVLIFP